MIFRQTKIGKVLTNSQLLNEDLENLIRKIVVYRITRTENEYSFTELLKSLRNRGLSPNKITIVVHDGEGSIRLGINNV